MSVPLLSLPPFLTQRGPARLLIDAPKEACDRAADLVAFLLAARPREKLFAGWGTPPGAWLLGPGLDGVRLLNRLNPSGIVLDGRDYAEVLKDALKPAWDGPLVVLGSAEHLAECLVPNLFLARQFDVPGRSLSIVALDENLPSDLPASVLQGAGIHWESGASFRALRESRSLDEALSPASPRSRSAVRM